MRLRLHVLMVALGLASAIATGMASQAPAEGSEFQKLDVVLGFLRNRNARDYAVTGANAIDEGKYVAIGGIEQWITIRGEDRRNPVLLVLHGGPGDATNPWGYAGLRSWMKAFTVVQWDQRGAGRTLSKNGPSSAKAMTVAMMAQDGIELAQLLCKALQKDKILVVGHSFGSILGVHMVKARPELFYAFVGTGQVVDSARNYSVAYDALIGKAQELGDERALSELKAVGPPPYADGRGYGVQRKWSNLFEHADAFLASMLGFALSAPGYSVKDINDWIEGQSLSAELLVPQTSALDPNTLAGEFKVPVFVIEGAEDFTTPTSLARDFVSAIKAPRKEFVAIEGGGHFAVFMKPEVFLNELMARVRPLAIAR